MGAQNGPEGSQKDSQGRKRVEVSGIYPSCHQGFTCLRDGAVRGISPRFLMLFNRLHGAGLRPSIPGD